MGILIPPDTPPPPHDSDGDDGNDEASGDDEEDENLPERTPSPQLDENEGSGADKENEAAPRTPTPAATAATLGNPPLLEETPFLNSVLQEETRHHCPRSRVLLEF